MIPILYQTPVSLSYLAQLILSAVITIVMVIHLRLPNNRVTRSFILTWFMFFLTLFIGLLYFESCSISKNRLIISYLENPVLAIVVLLLLQFAYRFPSLVIRRRWEAYVVLALSLAYAFLEFITVINRLVRLSSGEVINRQPLADYLLVSFMAGMILVFLYRYIALSTESTRGLRHKFGELLWLQDPAVREQWKPILSSFFSPQSPEARALRMFTFTAMLLPGLTIWNLLSGSNQVSAFIGSMGASLGILLGLFTFSVAYLNYQKEGISFMVKMAETSLVLVLALLAVVAWVIAPAFQGQFRVDLPVHQTLQFTPNEFNGYDINSLPLYFEENLGRNEMLGNSVEDSCKAIDFEFPLFGKKYSRVFACKDGVLSLGKPFNYQNFQLNYGSGVPMILPLLISLAPAEFPGSVFIQKQEEQLIITWMKQHAYYRPEAEFTFQLVLHSNGGFEITYRDLPAPESTMMAYVAEDVLGSSVWAVGVLPETISGKQEPQLVDLGSSLPLRSGPNGILQDYSLAFRSHLNELYFPLAVLVILSSFLIALGFPLLIYLNLVSPLNSLMRGVKQIDGGNLNVNVPVYYNDEIGFLTTAFNKMALWMQSMVTDLEARVRSRTSELAETNDKLANQIDALEEAQEKLLEQERHVAAMEERERLARDLHDGLGQVMSAVNIHSQAVQTFLSTGEMDAAETSNQNILDLTQDANLKIRRFILGLHETSPNPKNMVEAIRETLKIFSSQTGILTFLDWQRDVSAAFFQPAIEEQVLHIIQEALTNARKHSGAKRIDVMFSFDKLQAQMIISDDGIGFDTEQVTVDQSLHFGLGMMKERAHVFGGRLDVRSIPGQGTRILLTIPLLERQDQEQGQEMSIHGMRVLLVDDSPIFLEGMRSLLMARGLIVVGTALNGFQALEKTRQLQPDVIVMDVNMPVCDGLQALNLITPEFPAVKIVMLTVDDDEEILFEALKRGASGYLLKNLDANEFCSLLSGLTVGQAPLTPGLASRLLTEFAAKSEETENSPEIRTSDRKLSKRQKQILDLLVGNLSYKEIALMLKLTEPTVKYHMGQILEKLHLLNRADAVNYARRLRKKK